MIELVCAAADFDNARDALISGPAERCALFFASHTLRADGTTRLLVREIQFPTADDYSRQGLLEAELRPDFVARATKFARRQDYAIVFVHSHPGPDAPRFSTVDSAGEKVLAGFLAHRHPGPAHAALVVSGGGVCGRRLGTDEYMRVVTLGPTRNVLFDAAIVDTPVSEFADRQVRAIGVAGQVAIERLRIGIVGLGGTGSVVAQQLVHLGVRDFVLIDPDVLEATNLNRVASATWLDIDSPKVEIAGRYIPIIQAGRDCIPEIQGDVVSASVARELQNVDVMFGCTDSHGSRAVLQQVSYQYMVPCIDMGVTIAVTDARIHHIYGRVQLLSPGHGVPYLRRTSRPQRSPARYDDGIRAPG